MKETSRDVVTGDLTLEYFAKRFAEGWKVHTVEWSRETGASAGAVGESLNLLADAGVPPFGLKIGAGGLMEEHPVEAAALLIVLEQVVRERRVQEIAGELNARGYLTRNGFAWTATDVFNLLPRLIEAGPSLLKSTAWQQRRPREQPSQRA